MPKPYVGKHVGTGAKHCKKCGTQGAIDSSQQTKNGHVTRRYRCVVKKCGEKWTTVEHRVETNGLGNNTERKFMQRITAIAKRNLQVQLAELLGTDKPTAAEQEPVSPTKEK